MPFEDRLKASFRGVPFLLETADGTSGRRAIPNAYPKRDSGWTDDNGGVLKQEQITGRVLGDDYLDQLRAIEDALNTPGPGELIHPWYGVQWVQVGKVSRKLVINKDCTATFNFEVYEAGTPMHPSVKDDTATKLANEALSCQEAVNSYFEKTFDPEATEGLGDMLDTYLDDLEGFTRGLPSLPSGLREWTDRLLRAKASTGKLLAYPGKLAREGMGLLEDVKGLVTDPIRSLSVYDNVSNRWNGMRAELSATGGLSRNITSIDGKASSASKVMNPDEQAKVLNNAQAFKDLLLSSAAISKSRALASADLSNDLSATAEEINGLTGADRKSVITGQQLKLIGNNLATEIADLAEAAVERGDSSSWRQLRTLRHAVLNDTRERAELLPQLNIVQPTTTMPVSLIAWRETGDTDKRQSIVKRNGLSNPAFIRPSDTVEVIND